MKTNPSAAKQKALNDFNKAIAKANAAKAKLKAIDQKEKKAQAESKKRAIQIEALAIHEALTTGNKDLANKIAAGITARAMNQKPPEPAAD